MGRARVTLKHIQNERARKIAFMQRRKGLMKKVSDFSTMSGADACLIVYDGDSNGGPMTWPQDLTKVHSTLVKYETQKNEKPLKTFDLQDFFDNRKDMVETEISKVKKEIINVMYPTWNTNFNNLGEKEQRMFIATLDDKIEACNQRITMLKNKQQQNQEANSGFLQNMAQEIASSSGPSQLNFTQNISQSQLQLTPAPVKAPYDNNEMVNFTNHVGVPLNSTNQLVEPIDWANPLSEPVDWANYFGDDLLGSLGWATQLDDPVLHNNIPSQCHNEQQGASLFALPPPLDGHMNKKP
ncbi:hypothetical protein SESBI_02285 [Sesbania bispinosa]|nr:hypothetical protein SESBI_02285 [Sesbania bispinosa]